MTATLITISIITSFLSGFSKAIMDLSEEGKIKFKPSRYWIKAMSSPNKWKDGDPRKGEKFFGSSRWFVAQTDAWHLFGALMFYSYWISFTLSGFIIGYNFDNKYYLLLLKIPFLSRGIFHIFYTYKIFKK
jgi:hypothetical protein